jgi:RNA polymerase sigma-70 factor (ECF subfamily)
MLYAGGVASKATHLPAKPATPRTIFRKGNEAFCFWFGQDGPREFFVQNHTDVAEDKKMDPHDSGTAPQPLTHEQFMRLFLAAERELLRYVMALVPNVSDARDVVQETAVALWRASGKYDPARPFVPWACRFALNEARLYLRSESRRRRLIEEDVAAMLDDRRVDLSVALDARREHLRNCLDRLPEDQRRLVRGYYFEEESVEALAANLGRGAEAVYKALQRARQALLQCIERKLQTEA